MLKVPYKVGDKVVYMGHGVSVIKRIEKKSIAGAYTDVLVLATQTGLTIIAPMHKVSQVIRPIASKEDATKALDFIKNGKVETDTETWNKRYRLFMETIKSGQLMDIADVYKKLTTLKNAKDLSFGERKMLDAAKELVVNELTIALEVTELDLLTAITPIAI